MNEDTQLIFTMASHLEDTPNMHVEGDDLALATAGQCKWKGGADDPHLSNRNREASVHGWWIDENKDGSCPAFAEIEVWLQVYACDLDTWNCGWVTMGNNEDRVRAGGGRGKRVTARGDCAHNDELILWRNKVDVDLVDYSDHPFLIFRKKEIRCYPDW